MKNINKDSFVILRVTAEMRKAIYKKAKDMEITVSNLIREILETNI